MQESIINEIATSLPAQMSLPSGLSNISSDQRSPYAIEWEKRSHELCGTIGDLIRHIRAIYRDIGHKLDDLETQPRGIENFETHKELFHQLTVGSGQLSGRVKGALERAWTAIAPPSSVPAVENVKNRLVEILRNLKEAHQSIENAASFEERKRTLRRLPKVRSFEPFPALGGSGGDGELTLRH